MKKFRKIMAILVAAVMIVAMAVPAWAAFAEDKTVTITFDKGNGTGAGGTKTTTVTKGNDYAWYELPALSDFESTSFVAPQNKSVFLGWTSTKQDDTTNASPALVKRVLVPATSTGITLYACWGTTNAASGGDSRDFTDNGSITIHNSVNNETYSAYQLFQLYSFTDTNTLPDEHDEDTEAYAYYIASGPSADEKHPMHDFLKQYKIDGTNNLAFTFYDADTTDRRITVDDVVYTPVKATTEFMTTVSAKADEDKKTEYQGTSAKVQAFAMKAMEYINTNLTEAQRTALKKGTATGNGTDAKINNLPLGYYLVDSTLGSLCVLDTTNTDISVVEKNEFSSSEKKVKENSYEGADTGFGDKNDANFGDIVTFKSTVVIPLRQSDVIYHDWMSSDAFDLKTINVSGVSEKTGDIVNYKIYTNVSNVTTSATEGVTTFPTHKADPNDQTSADVIDDEYSGDTFAIWFNPVWSEGTNNPTTPTTVTITYTAQLKTTAIVGDQKNSNGEVLAKRSGNDNIAWVTYGGQQTSSEDWTRTYTWEYNIFKYAQYDKIETVTTEADRYKAKATYGTDGSDVKAAHKAGYIRNTDTTDTKVDGDHYWIKAKPLDGAVFNMYSVTSTKDPSTNEITTAAPVALKFVEVVSVTNMTQLDANDAHTGVYRLALTGETGTEDLTTYSGTNGIVTIVGIDSIDEAENITTTYQLKEKTAPTGYFKTDDTFPVVLAKSGGQGDDNATQAGTVTLNSADYNKSDIAIENFTGTEMPMTGGMGTTVLYIVGGMLVILAGAYLFFSRKRTA